DRWPKKQDSPWPKDRGHNRENHGSRCVIRTDATIRDNWQRKRTLTKEIEAISGEDKAADDIDQVMLIRKNWRQRHQKEPDDGCNSSETARVTKVDVEKH